MNTKREVADTILRQSGQLFIHLNPKTFGIVLPLHLRQQDQVVLQVGYNMVISIPDLEVGPMGISGTLAFNSRPHFCEIPWEAIFALVGVDGRGQVFAESMPPSVQDEKKREQAVKVRRIGLRLIQGGKK